MKLGSLGISLALAAAGLAFAEGPVAYNDQPNQVNDQEVIQLVQWLGDPSFDKRQDASKRLTEIGPAVLPALFEATRDTDPEISLRSWRIIDDWAAKGDVDALLCQLKCTSASVRACAAEALGKVEPRPQSAIPALIAAADDGKDFVRAAARESLKKIQVTLGLRIEVTESLDRVEAGNQTVYRVDVTNCGMAPATNIQIKAVLPQCHQLIEAKGANQPVQHHADGPRLTTEGITLDPNATVRWEVTAQALRPGEARFKIELASDELPYPLIEEKNTTVHPAGPKPDKPGDQ
jgi:uncharacterized repeat protein (TIGR01451 family)